MHKWLGTSWFTFSSFILIIPKSYHLELTKAYIFEDLTPHLINSSIKSVEPTMNLILGLLYAICFTQVLLRWSECEGMWNKN